MTPTAPADTPVCARPHCGHPATAHTQPDPGVCRRCNPRALHACHGYRPPKDTPEPLPVIPTPATPDDAR